MARSSRRERGTPSSTSCNNNTSVGRNALNANTVGNNNTALGNFALRNNVSGSSNLALGYQAGLNATGSNNIYLRHNGVAGESNTIRIGQTQTKTFLVGTVTWWVLGLLGSGMPYLYCLLFGALISPTDPIAVLGILKTAGAPKSLEMNITGESLFNDGVGIVVFLVILEIVTGRHEVIQY